MIVISKAKSHTSRNLTKALVDMDDPVIVTYDLVEKWHGILNEELFHGALSSLREKQISLVLKRHWKRPEVGFQKEGQFLPRADPPHSGTVLVLRVRYSSFCYFLHILAHEMVHQWQWEMKHSLSHGNTFKRWIIPFRKKGMYLGTLTHYSDIEELHEKTDRKSVKSKSTRKHTRK